MGKRGKASRKRNRENSDVSPSTIAAKILKKHIQENNQGITSDDDDVQGCMHGISDEALHTTIATLRRLCGLKDNTSEKAVIKEKRYRNLRSAIYDLQKALGVTTIAKSVMNNGIGVVGMGMNTFSSSKITNDITEQIENGAWETAIATLRNLGKIQALQDRSGPSKYRPKLGALQRWVREIDAAGTDDPLALEVLDAMLRVVAPESLVSVNERDLAHATWSRLGVGMGTADTVHIDSRRGRIRLFPAFNDVVDVVVQTQERMESNDIYDKLVEMMTCGPDGIRRISNMNNTIVKEDCFRVCGHEDGPDRKPPNKYDLDLLTTSMMSERQQLNENQQCKTISSCNVLFEHNTSCDPIKKTPIPYVHGTFLLENVLSHQECDRLIAAAEMAGYCPDEPFASQPGASILAHACVWVIDHRMERVIFDRVKQFLPPFKCSKQSEGDGNCKSVEENLHPLGVNRRFRFYRYIPGRYYRPHIDGAWPPSGFDIAGNYRYDVNDISNKNGIQFVQPDNAKCDDMIHNVESMATPAHERTSVRAQLSRLTFLIYLNDDFDGGHTTFFIPAEEHEGVLNAFPVKPSRGCVLVFPHGVCSAPLHEGSPVLKGCKYVVRTEVEYFV